MRIVGEREFVEIPGSQMHELPPLLVLRRAEIGHLDRVMRMAREMVESEDLIPPLPLDEAASDINGERRRMDLALNLVEQYLRFVDHWQWGDGILGWIRQCEITFETTAALRSLLRPDIWPHAARSSFVTLLEDKRVPHPEVELSKAVGLRLTFRQPPPLACFSDQFLFYLNSPIADSAFQAWIARHPLPVSFLPPERFQLQVVRM